MNRFRHSRAVRLLALLAGLALGLLPADLLAGCGCEDCACHASASPERACCCQSPPAKAPAGNSCCAKHAAPSHSCRPVAGCAASGGCHCEVTRSNAAADLSARAVRPAKANAAFSTVGSLPTLAAIEATLVGVVQAHPPYLSPPLRVLYCSWRN